MEHNEQYCRAIYDEYRRLDKKMEWSSVLPGDAPETLYPQDVERTLELEEELMEKCQEFLSDEELEFLNENRRKND